MNPLSFLLCLLSLLPAAVTALKTQAQASQTTALAAERRELAEIRLLIQVERDFATAKQRLAKLAESLAQRAEADANDLAAEVERVRQDVALALGQSVTPASGQDAVDRAVFDALAREDLHFIGQLGRRAVPGLVQAVRANPDVFPSDGAKDPLMLLEQHDVLAASRLAGELLHVDGFFWKKRVVRMLENVGDPSDHVLWAEGGGWLGDGFTDTAEKLVDDPDVGGEALEFLLRIGRRGWRSEALDAAIERALHGPGSDRRWAVERAIQEAPKLVGRARLESWLRDEDRRLRAFAASRLGAAFPESDLPFAYFTDSSPAVRSAVLGWLFRKRSARWTAAELDALVRFLRDESTEVSDGAWNLLKNAHPTVQYAPPIPDPELARMLGTRPVYADPLPEEALQGLVEGEKDPKRRVILADIAPRFPAALALRILAVLANDRDQAVLENVRDSLVPVLGLEDPQGYLRVVGTLLDNEATTERRKIHFLVRWQARTLAGLRIMLPWLLARRDSALFLDVFGDESSPFNPTTLIQAQPADVAEFVAQAWDLVRVRAKQVGNDDLPWTMELSAAFRELARDANRPVGLRVLALRGVLHRGGADEDALAIARSILSSEWRNDDELEALVENFVQLLRKLPGAEVNTLLVQILRNPVLPETLASSSAQFLDPNAGGADEVVKLVIERGFGKWTGALAKVLGDMAQVPTLHDPEVLTRAARDPRHSSHALWAIGNLGDPRYLPLLADLVEHPDSAPNRERAIEALFGYLDAEAAEILLAAAGKPIASELRDRCLAHLEKIREYQDARERWASRRVKAQTREQVIAQLVEQLGSKSDEIRVQAIRALATWEAVEVMPRLIELTASGSKSVATAAREALARLNQPAEARKE